jgi:hypothetical protein
MAQDKLDLEKVKEFLSKHLAGITEAGKVKFRAIQKAVKSHFGKGMFMPQLSEVLRSVRPDLAKPARKKARRRGRKPGPKPGRRGGRRPGRPAGSSAFLVQVGRKLQLAKSRDRVQAVIDNLVAAGKSIGRLKVFALTRIGVATKVMLE